VSIIGALENGEILDNRANFPGQDIDVHHSDTVYEIPNAFPFKGTTYISKYFADQNARNPNGLALPEPPAVSLATAVKRWVGDEELSAEGMTALYQNLPEPLLLALATTSTDPVELSILARQSCRFNAPDATGTPGGLLFSRSDNGNTAPLINNPPLFKALANNPKLPEAFRRVMVLTPGTQGDSAITGEHRGMEGSSHVFEYLRVNSYIPWGHYAANMADDTIRYDAGELTSADMCGMRHLYYQRTYARMAGILKIPGLPAHCTAGEEALETLRISIGKALTTTLAETPLDFTGTLWGWNYGFDYTPTGYRLNGSHQQIHQQYALVPHTVPTENRDASGAPSLPSFACGDLIKQFIGEFRRETGRSFFDCYIRAIRGNRRMEGTGDGEHRLVVYEDDHVMLFVPKAQTSQWELQLMTLKPVGNILEADTDTRRALDDAMLRAVKVLSALGARLITSIEYSKRFNNPDSDQRLLYCFLPRLPQSPGAFSEAQLRWINRHYPEDFAAACRRKLAEIDIPL